MSNSEAAHGESEHGESAHGDPMSNLTPAQKASLTSGDSIWSSPSIPGVLESIVLSDGPHGIRRQTADGDALGIGDSVPATCFPPAVGLASTWNDDLIEEVGRQLGREAKALGVSVLLGPGINIRRSPLGGRNFEYASEDPLVSGRYGVAMVKGIQSQDVAATPKHFAVNNQETDRFRVSAEVDERTLREIYLPAFERVVTTAAPWALMGAYNRVNGVPASENHWLLTELLRDEWGFDGVVMSDWGAVDDRVAALMAGLDLEMPPSGSDERIAAALESGEVTDARLNEVLDRLTRLVERTAPSRAEQSELDADAGDQVAYRAALESIVLLANNGILPLARGAARLAVIGEFARSPRYQGGGSSRVVPTTMHNALDELTDRQGSENVAFAAGFRLDGTPDEALVTEALETAASAEVAIVFVGLPDGSESEGSDRAGIDLPAVQIELLNKLVASQTPVVVVLSGGGTIAVGPWREGAAAILQASLLGQAGGAATADILVGAATPSGRLTETIPVSLNETPAALNFPGRDGEVHYGEGVFVGYRWYDTLDKDVCYPFGHGLTYGEVTYGEAQVKELGRNNYRVSVQVTSTATMPIAEVVQLYVGTDGAQQPVHELRGYTKVSLDPGETTEVTFELVERDFSYWNITSQGWRVEPGEYTIEVGASSRDIRSRVTVTSAGDGQLDDLTRYSTIGEWVAHPVGREIIAPLTSAVAEKVSGDAAPELVAMFLQMPLAKLVSWGAGFTEEMLVAMVSAATEQTAAARAAAETK